MDKGNILFIILIWIKFCTSELCTHQTSCSDCVESGPSCAWCSDEPEIRGFRTIARCNTIEVLKSNCTNIYSSVGGSVKILEDKDLKDVTREGNVLDAVQIKPQKVLLKLRPHETQTFEMIYRPAKNYPLDLYYLMDLSWSMKDDKEMLADLKDDLPRTLKKLTENSQVGFGSFADKTTLPYTSIAKALLKNPCGKDPNRNCSPSYEFRHHLKLTDNFEDFARKVKRAEVTANLDDLEGGLSALIQAIVCKREIGWKNKSRKIIIYATNGLVHVAGEGKLGGAVIKNDCNTCHLVNGTYDKTNIDYPSLACIHKVLMQEKVFVIFAVTEDRQKQYFWPQQLMDQYTSLALLKNDSSNILELVEAGYNKTVSSAKFIDDAGSYLSVKYLTNCGNEPQNMVETNKCEQIEVGKEYNFTVEVTLLKCPRSKSLWRNILKIEEQLTQTSISAQLELLCGCPCQDENQTIPDSSLCNSHGNLTCGQCACNPGWAGRVCNCNLGNAKSTSQLNDECIKKTEIPLKNVDGDPDWTLVDSVVYRKRGVDANEDEPYLNLGPKYCSGNGECLCGECKCSRGYTGEYCECKECPRSGAETCGGSLRGRCDCGNCECSPGWSGDACDCSTDTNECRPTKSGRICSGYGICECGKCKCGMDASENQCYGKFCENCGLTNKFCALFENCARCYVHSSRKRRQSKGIICHDECFKGYSNQTETELVDTLQDPSQVCTFQSDHEGKTCHHEFTYESIDEDKQQFKLLITSNCKDRIGAAALSGYIILGTLLIGLLILLCVYCYDRRKKAEEVALFDGYVEKNQINLEHVEKNPLYDTPITTVDLTEIRKKYCEGCRNSNITVRSSITSTNMNSPPRSPLWIPEEID